MYIAHKNLPPRIQLATILFWWMFLDYVSAPVFVYWIVGIIVAVVTIHNIIRVFTEREVDIL